MANNVSFDEEPAYTARPSYAVAQKKSGGITGLTLKLGIARTEKEATTILVVVIIICVILSVIVFIAVQPHAHPTDPAQFQRDLIRMRSITPTQPSQ